MSIDCMGSTCKARALSRPTSEWGKSGCPLTAPEPELAPPVLLLHGRPVVRDRAPAA
ncbi:unnamed protein product [Plutella xylostella]|uniref:(diamondback moth) hypothetical protein n=1 Tax=Plutella xylostella TaxID=51655 RepID=A0A8S4D218_PLUXY|nr:unnamed protein product [Plutella xylostella]